MTRKLQFIAAALAALATCAVVHATPVNQVVINIPLTPIAAEPLGVVSVSELSSVDSNLLEDTTNPPQGLVAAVFRTYKRAEKEGDHCASELEHKDWDIPPDGKGKCYRLDGDGIRLLYLSCPTMKREWHLSSFHSPLRPYPYYLTGVQDIPKSKCYLS